MEQGDLTIDHYIRSTWLTIQKMYNEQASKFDSTMVLGFALLSLDPKQGTPSTSLGPRMGMEPTSLSRTLKKLEERGMIVRENHPEDKRSVLIYLTDEGLKMRDVSKKVVLTFYEAIEERIPQQELDIFFDVLYKINEIAVDKEIYKEKEYKS
ncbi:MAG: MarR family transcriptional regulator [Weeksellaceae bacterium]|jgi:DNA-binding MarR family transcriptional regulator|nr:MarR family transcriptional regulator [Weeksellaceae bacterium]